MEFDMSPLNIAELPLSSKVSIWWSIYWRGIFITFGSAFCGGSVGFIVGLILRSTGLRNIAPTITGTIGFAIGSAFFYVFIRWLLSARLGKFRLVLIRA